MLNMPALKEKECSWTNGEGSPLLQQVFSADSTIVRVRLIVGRRKSCALCGTGANSGRQEVCRHSRRSRRAGA